MKNADVIQRFIYQDSGYKGSNLYSSGSKLINYNTIIAQWFDDVLLINVTKYSCTTSTHQNRLLYHAERKNIRYYTVDDIPMSTKDLTYLYKD